MSYGVALRNGVPFTLGTIAALCTNATGSAWSPLALWPDGIATPGMWISPRDLTSQWADYTGTTPVSVPGTVADSANPVGLALDIRAGAPEVLGPELVTNGSFAGAGADWSLGGANISFANNRAELTAPGDFIVYQALTAPAGKLYLVEWDQYVPSGGRFFMRLGDNAGDTQVYAFGSGHKAFYVYSMAPGTSINFVQGGCDTGDWFDNISVREVPGNHMLQSTSAARPLLSARVNLLTYTEDFSGWNVESGVLTSTSPPEGVASATKYTFTTGGSVRVFGASVAATTPSTYSILARAGTGFTYLNIRFENSPSNVGICVNLLTGAITAGHRDGAFPLTAPSASDAVEYGDGWWRIEITNSSFGMTFLYPSNNADSTNDAYTAGDYFEFTALQLNRGTTATDYQPILTDGSTYPSTGFPIAQKYDGVDDGMATAAFPAGTLIDGMDCMIPVRRDSAAATYLISNTGSRGFFEWESGDTNRPDVSAGTPTYYVDGVTCTATRGALFTALTAGDWHILEARGLDLSTWTALEVSGLVSYRLNGARGDILLYPSTTPTADKDAARQWLADYYGVTLP